MAYKKSTRKFSRKGSRKSYRKKTVRRTSSLTKRVKKEISKLAEVKRASYSSSQFITGYGYGTVQQNLGFVSGGLTINQGTGQGDRIGNKIRIKSIVLHYSMCASAYSVANPNPEPWEVRMVFGKNRSLPQTAPPILNFFQQGDTSVAPTGQLQDIIKPINVDTQLVYKEKFHKLGYSRMDGSGNAGGVASQYYSNNDYKLNAKGKVDLTKMFPTTVMWNDTSVQPVTDSVYVSYICATGTGTTNGSSQPLGMNFTVEVQYTDI